MLVQTQISPSGVTNHWKAAVMPVYICLTFASVPFLSIVVCVCV